MKKVVVASRNPVKLAATEVAFRTVFPGQNFEFISEEVLSGVADQPMSDEETQQGVWNRAQNAQKRFPDAEYWVGLEGGVDAKDNQLEAFAWMEVTSKDGLQGSARTASFVLPPKIAELIKGGMELGTADDIVFSKTNSKQQNGAVGILTDNAVTRKTYYEHALVLALIPHKNPDLYI